MPQWLILMLINLAIKTGLAFVVKKFPWIPQSVIDAINELLEKLKNHKDQKEVLVREAKQKIEQCLTEHCISKEAGK